MSTAASQRGRWARAFALGAALAASAALPPLAAPAAAPIPLPQRPPSAKLDLELPDVPVPPASAAPSAGIATPAPALPGVAAPAIDPLRLEVPGVSGLSVTPSLRLDGGLHADPNDIRAAAPQSQVPNPSAGLGAQMNLGDVTLGAQLNRPLRGPEERLTPDGRAANPSPNFGVDMRLKF